MQHHALFVADACGFCFSDSYDSLPTGIMTRITRPRRSSGSQQVRYMLFNHASPTDNLNQAREGHVGSTLVQSNLLYRLVAGGQPGEKNRSVTLMSAVFTRMHQVRYATPKKQMSRKTSVRYAYREVHTVYPCIPVSDQSCLFKNRRAYEMLGSFLASLQSHRLTTASPEVRHSAAKPKEIARPEMYA